MVRVSLITSLSNFKDGFFKEQKKQNFIFLFSGNILDVPLENNDWNFNRTTGDENEISLEISRFGKNPHLPPVIISPKDYWLLHFQEP